ncbi:MAG: hypothetical protein HC887_10010 [Desulfobacteraceae bacterium]|nr:hypothetical protein [Desulfobacteraceae bacterium]
MEKRNVVSLHEVRQEKQRARDAEAKAEQERLRAEQEKQRAHDAEVKAEQERLRAEMLEEKLKALEKLMQVQSGYC